ncbi:MULTISPECIES: hypothetical protein [unclassified Rhodanobacter]
MSTHAQLLRRLRQVSRKTQIVAGQASVLGYGYTAAGRLASITYPSGARVD